jgi:hypothetical protein
MKLNTKKKQLLSLVAVAVTLVLFLVPLTFSSSAAFTGEANPANNAITSGSVMTQKGGEAGYEVYSTKPGSTLFVEALMTVPSATCVNDLQAVTIYVGIGHYYLDDVGSFLIVQCTASIGGIYPSYAMYFFDGSTFGYVKVSVKAGDVINTTATESLKTGATTVSIQDPKESWAAEYNGNVGASTSGGEVYWYLEGNGSPSSSNPLLQFSTFKLGSLSVGLSGHTGSLGSFKSIKGVTIYEYIFIDPSNNHVLAKPTSISSTSKSFKVNWIMAY